MPKHPDYGIDAPGVLVMFFALGILCLVLGVFARPIAIGTVTIDSALPRRLWLESFCSKAC